MPSSGFRIKIILRNRDIFERMAGKLANLTDLFGAIIDRWVAHNTHKFEEAEGKQATGVSMPGSDVFWMPLDPVYEAAKTRAGYDDQLMVRDGDLEDSLTNLDSADFFEEVTPMSARFGTTLPQAVFNFQTRPTSFLDVWDQSMIESTAVAFLGDRPPFLAFAPSPVDLMDAEFAAMFGAGA